MTVEFKHMLGMERLSAKTIEYVLDTAENLKEISSREVKKVPALRGKLVIMAFFEPSTRTKASFDIAAKRLSADSLAIGSSGSSVVKGETLIDTCRNLEAMQPDILVIRHKSSGAPQLIAERTGISVINAGDGQHEHPTQALLDLLTIRQHKGKLAGLKVAIVGDITHSRVAHSNIYALVTSGADVHVAGPTTMIPRDLDRLGCTIHRDVGDAVEQADVVMTLRVQLERMEKNLFPTNREYARYFGIRPEVLKLAKKDHILMHPGPINRGVELDPGLADGMSSVILDQVRNGVAVRMALLFLLAGRGGDA